MLTNTLRNYYSNKIFLRCLNSVTKSQNTIPPNLNVASEIVKQDNLNIEETPRLKQHSYLLSKSDSNRSIVKIRNQQTVPFDEIPGPASLKAISKFWGLIPTIGTELTVGIVQSLLSGGKLFGGLISWGGDNSFLRKFFDVYGPVVRLHGAFGNDVVLLNRSEHASIVFESDEPHYIRSCLDSVEKYRLEFRTYKQTGPLIMQDTEWDKIRKSINRPHQSSIIQHRDKINNISDEFIERINNIRTEQDEIPNSFKGEIYKWALECLSVVTFNRKLGAFDPYGTSPTSDSGRLLEGLIGATEAARKCEYSFHLWKFMETPSWKNLVRNCDMVDNVLSRYLRKSIKLLNDKKQRNDNFTNVSIIERLLLKEGIVEEDVMTILLDMFLIGANATSHTVAYLLYHLARNPRCQIKLYEELTNKSTRGNLKSLSYLQACIKECLRLDSPIPILSRVLNNDVIIHHYRIPKGTHVLFATHLNSLREEYFEDAQKFKPERWLSNELDHLEIGNQAYASMSFGHGPKSCLAKDIAEFEIAMLVVKICKTFKIEYNYGEIKTTHDFLDSKAKPLKFRFISRVVYTLGTIPTNDAWDAPSIHQYHIQTDEGPERYFRYQTDSGQYRKEKRLADGTVIGTYAWIDGDGILRQRDYIADSAGYRILKSKNIFVGRNINVGDAVKAVKKLPASAGTLVKSYQRPVVTVPQTPGLPVTTYRPSTIQSTSPVTLYSTTSRPYLDILSNGVPSSTPLSVVTSTEPPVVEITPNSYIPPPTLLLTPPKNLTETYLPSTEATYYQTTPVPTAYIPPYQKVQPIDQNNLDYNPYVQQNDQGYRFHNGPTYPLDRNGKPYIGQHSGNGYDPQYPTYDGVSVTNDGFRYYIPRAYHEEQTLPGGKRDGSFGYIDPFGIRRVIYYNTAPGSGFQHRKNNRYVGFDATPYDPRPY